MENKKCCDKKDNIVVEKISDDKYVEQCKVCGTKNYVLEVDLAEVGAKVNWG